MVVGWLVMVGVPLLTLGGLALAVTLAVYLNWGVAMRLLRRRFPSVFWFQETTNRVVALTIDDAPTPNTNEILDILDQYDCKATFFVISSYAKKYPQIMERIIASGHEIGNHMCKDRASIKLSAEEYEDRLLECDQVLTDMGAFSHIPPNSALSLYHNNPYLLEVVHSDSSTEVPLEGPRYFKWTRPGSGWFSQTMLDTAKRHGYSLALGNVYPHDPQVPIPWLNGRHVVACTRPGSIIIIHDRPYTAPALRFMLKSLVERDNYRFVTLTELASHTDDATPSHESEELPDM